MEAESLVSARSVAAVSELTNFIGRRSCMANLPFIWLLFIVLHWKKLVGARLECGKQSRLFLGVMNGSFHALHPASLTFFQGPKSGH